MWSNTSDFRCSRPGHFSVDSSEFWVACCIYFSNYAVFGTGLVESRLAMSYLPSDRDAVQKLCAACRSRHLCLLYFHRHDAVAEVRPVTGVSPRQVGRPLFFSVSSQHMPIVVTGRRFHADGCTCGGAHSCFFSPIYENPRVHSFLFSLFLKPRDAIVAIIVPWTIPMLRSTAGPLDQSACPPFAPSGAYQKALRDHTVGTYIRAYMLHLQMN